jgi:hypothetical protein
LGGDTYLVEQANPSHLAFNSIFPTDSVIDLKGLVGSLTTASTAFNGILTLHG